jgi:uncharacterized membrane protein
MNWLQRYHIRRYLRDSMWIPPTLSMLVALGVAPFLNRIDTTAGAEAGLNAGNASLVLDTMASSMFTFIVFVCSALLVAVQLASSLLTPRIIGIVFRDGITKLALAVFVFTFTLTVTVMVQLRTSVPVLTGWVAALCGMASLAMFFYLIHHVGMLVRPSGALWVVAALGRKVIESVYPQRLSESVQTGTVQPNILKEIPMAIVADSRDGVILAFDLRGLVALAERADCVLELVPQVGDFFAAGDPLFRVYRGGANLRPEELRHCVAVGLERTMEQDPAFAFRIIVDIANKGLSPAINDPTTAVLALDQIHHLLRNVGCRSLADGQVLDASGKLRLVYRTPNWPDFVSLAITEIRHYGGSSIQIVRRLKAMLEDLIHTLPPVRAPLLLQELAVLQRTAARFFPEPEDQALADISDSQGVGGKHGDGQPKGPITKGTAP